MNSRPGVTATMNMAVLPGVLGCSFDYAQDRLSLRRTVQVRLGTNPAVPWDGCQVARSSSWSRDSNSWNIQARYGLVSPSPIFG
jgi:hypothetical protein